QTASLRHATVKLECHHVLFEIVAHRVAEIVQSLSTIAHRHWTWGLSALASRHIQEHIQFEFEACSRRRSFRGDGGPVPGDETCRGNGDVSNHGVTIGIGDAREPNTSRCRSEWGTGQQGASMVEQPNTK